MSKREEVVEQALALSPDAELNNSTLATAWTKEIDRRLAALEEGELNEIDLETALNEIRRELQRGGE